MAKPPYVPARLANSDKPVSVRWYIVFWAWDAEKMRLVRKRDYEINIHKTKAARLEFARKRIAAINSILDDGAHISPKAKKRQDAVIAATQYTDLTVEQAFKHILPIIKKTKRPDTYTSYSSVAGLFQNYCELVGWEQWKVKTLDKPDIINFLDYIQVTGTAEIGNKKEGTTVSNTTRNNYKTALSALFTAMLERKMLDKNPVLGIKELGEDEGRKVAYTAAQIEILKPAIIKKEPRLWLFITFMLYGFARPSEIGKLRVHMVDLKNNEIRLPGAITKNHKNKRIRIGKPFRAYINQLQLTSCDQNDFIFGYNLATCPRHIQKNYAGNLHRDIIRPLGFGAEYGLYPWKHTGIINHYKAGIDIKTLQEQIGHQSLEETDIYLKSLHLYANTEFEDKSPAL